MCIAQGPQRSDASEAWTRGPSVSSQALYHWATVSPHIRELNFFNCWVSEFLKLNLLFDDLNEIWKNKK